MFGLAECQRKILGKGWVPKLIKYIFESDYSLHIFCAPEINKAYVEKIHTLYFK